MHISLLVSVLFLCSQALGAYVINVDEFFRIPAADADEDLFDVEGLLKEYGYPFESHEVTTEDGYVLGIHRIPYGKDGPDDPKDPVRPSVLLMHGTDESSVDFFILGPERSLALMLADRGYDVWLGNNRGNTWSRKHTTLDPDKDKEFWDFSFHELGVYDDTAIIDHILGMTKNEQLSYVGHSRGTTQFFAMASTKPDYNDKITVMAALGPAVYVQHITNPIFQYLKDYYDLVELVIDALNITEVLPHSGTLSTTLESICGDNSDLQEICATVLFFIFGFDSDQLDRTNLPVIFQNFPAGASIKDLKHYLQEVKSGHFRQFDYGEDGNGKVYNKLQPPDYDLAFITAPVALYYGQNDWLVGLPDVDRLADELPNVADKHLIEYEKFTHLDFLFAKDVVSLLYNDVVDMLNVYNGDKIFTRPTPPTYTVPNSDSSTEEPTTPGSASIAFSWIQVFCSSLLLVLVKLLA